MIKETRYAYFDSNFPANNETLKQGDSVYLKTDAGWMSWPKYELVKITKVWKTKVEIEFVRHGKPATMQFRRDGSSLEMKGYYIIPNNEASDGIIAHQKKRQQEEDQYREQKRKPGKVIDQLNKICFSDGIWDEIQKMLDNRK